MQIFTLQVLIDAIHQTREIKQMLFETILPTAWQNMLTFMSSVWVALIRHYWSALPIKLLLLVGGITLLYHLVRIKPFMALKSIGDINDCLTCQNSLCS